MTSSETPKPSDKKFVALDTDVMLRLAVGCDTCCGIVDWFIRKNIFVVVLSIVFHELEELRRSGPDAFVRNAAEEALRGINNWGFLDASLTPVQNGMVGIFASRMAGPDATSTEERNLMLFCEAGMQDCMGLATYSDHLLNIDSQELQFNAMSSGLSEVFIFSPDELSDYLKKHDS